MGGWFCNPGFTVSLEVHQIGNRGLIWKSQKKMTAIEWVYISICSASVQISCWSFPVWSSEKSGYGTELGESSPLQDYPSPISLPQGSWAPGLTAVKTTLHQTQEPELVPQLHRIFSYTFGGHPLPSVEILIDFLFSVSLFFPSPVKSPACPSNK